MKPEKPRGNAAWMRCLGSMVHGCTLLPARSSYSASRFHLENTASCAGNKPQYTDGKSLDTPKTYINYFRSRALQSIINIQKRLTSEIARNIAQFTDVTTPPIPLPPYPAINTLKLAIEWNSSGAAKLPYSS